MSLKLIPDPFKLSSTKQIVNGKIFHKWIVVGDSGKGLFQTGVSVERHSGMETFAVFQNIQGKGNL